MNLLLETDYLRIFLYPAPEILEMEWLDFVSGSNFQNGVLAALQLGRQHAAKGWIGNNRQMRAIRAADQAWFQSEALPQLLALPGLKCTALVESEDAMNRMAVRGLRQHLTIPMAMPCQAFPTPEEARAWVREVLAAD